MSKGVSSSAAAVSMESATKYGHRTQTQVFYMYRAWRTATSANMHRAAHSKTSLQASENLVLLLCEFFLQQSEVYLSYLCTQAPVVPSFAVTAC